MNLPVPFFTVFTYLIPNCYELIYELYNSMRQNEYNNEVTENATHGLSGFMNQEFQKSDCVCVLASFSPTKQTKKSQMSMLPPHQLCPLRLRMVDKHYMCWCINPLFCNILCRSTPLNKMLTDWTFYSMLRFYIRC